MVPAEDRPPPLRSPAARRLTRAPDLATLRRSPLYSEELGLDLASLRERDLFLWFLASLLFGQRISETISRHTYESFVRHGLTTPQRILDAGWDYLVNPVMREGGYVRYDESKSRKLLRDCRTLIDEYGGRVARLHEAARDAADLEARLLAFYGVGPVTANIFLRELRPHWAKADPEPLPVVRAVAERLGINLDALERKSVAFARVEAVHHSRSGGSSVPGFRLRPGSAEESRPTIRSTPASEMSCSIHGAWSVPTPWWWERVPPWSMKDCWIADFTTSYCSSSGVSSRGGKANVKYRHAPEW